MTKETMNINLSETEIRALLVALRDTQRFNDEDLELDQSSTKTNPGTTAWLQRKFAAEDLSKKLTKVLALASDEAKAERMMKGTASPVDVEPLCPNDPVNW